MIPGRKTGRGAEDKSRRRSRPARPGASRARKAHRADAEGVVGPMVVAVQKWCENAARTFASPLWRCSRKVLFETPILLASSAGVQRRGNS
jgi:hypothetical protein